LELLRHKYETNESKISTKDLIKSHIKNTEKELGMRRKLRETIRPLAIRALLIFTIIL